MITRVLSVLEIGVLVFQASCARPSPTVSLTPEASIPPAGLVTLPSSPTLTPTFTPTETPTPTFTPTETLTPTPVALNVPPEVKVVLDSQKAPYTVDANGNMIIDNYDTQTVENTIINHETITVIHTADGLNPNIVTAKDAQGNLYALNPDLGWFKVPEVQMNYADLTKYTEVDQAFMEDGRNNIVRALNYVNSPDKISPDAHFVFWVTARGKVTYGNGNDNMLCLNFFPTGAHGEAQVLWPKEYQDYVSGEKNYVFSGFYKVKLKTGEYVYVIDRTIKIDDTHTSGLSNGFDKATYEKMNIVIGGYARLDVFFIHAKKGMEDLITILPPPEQLADGTPISFDPNTTFLENEADPIVAGLQGPRGSLIKLFSEEDQKRILDVLTALRHKNPKIVNPVTAPLTDPSQLVKLANHILLSTFAAR